MSDQLHDLRELLEREPAARALLDAIMAAVPSGLTLAASPETEILRVSDYGSRLLQRPRDRLENIVATSHTEAYRVKFRSGEPVPPEQLPLTRAAAGELVEGEELVVVAEDGTHIDILCNAGPVRDADGRLLGGVIAWTDIRAQRDLQARLEELAGSRELLMREMHHRVKNHLSMLGALAALQARAPTGDAAYELEKISRRLNVFAALHDQFYRAKYGESVQALPFLDDVCSSFRTPRIAIQVSIGGDIYLSPSQAAPVGMITSEAVCNSAKHAFGASGGTIDVNLVAAGERLRLTIDDDGVGISPDASRRASGSRLNNALAREIGGALEIIAKPGGGTRVALTF